MVDKKTVYVGMSADIIHPGHLNIIREAQKLGRVIVRGTWHPAAPVRRR